MVEHPTSPFPTPGGRVNVCEVWARDGLQGWPEVISTEAKFEVIRLAVEAGIREVDATSLVSPRATPQFGDAIDLLQRLRTAALEATIRVLTVNTRSFDRLAQHPELSEVVDVCGFPISASEPHNLANLHRSHAEHKLAVEAMVKRCYEMGFAPLLCIATAFGCPLAGTVTHDQVLELAHWADSLGVTKLMLGDTTGMADPSDSYRLWSRVADELPQAELFAHFHDTRGSGIANTLAAISAGVRNVDTSFGGAGGEPPTVEQHHSGESGNVVTEDLVALLERMGYDTGVDLEKLLAAGRRVEEISQTILRSQVQRAGLAVPAG
jgi:hydroxymethylglutaryl-CoA lyase